MSQRIRGALGGEQGFAGIEMLIVVAVLGVVLGIAVPSYLGFRDRAANNASKANLRAALPSAEAFYADNGTYAGMDAADLVAIDSGVSPPLTVAAAGAATYCLTDTVSGKTWSVAGPGPSSADFHPSNNCT